MLKKNQPIVFPADHQAHPAIIEWWYFNGQLKDAQGRAYSFMDCLFKADIKKVKIPFLRRLPWREKGWLSPEVYFAHSVLSDLAEQKSYKEIQNISLVSRDSFSRPRLFVDYMDPLILRGYVNYQMSEDETGDFHLKTENLDLCLKSRKKPLLEGGDGYISVCGRESYYYSLTDLAVDGRINISGEWQQVSGRAWMDHQWADVAYSRDKWSWFSLQLSNGLDIMCVKYEDQKRSEVLVDLLDKTGRDRHLKDLILTPGQEVYRSRQTKAEYPMTWTIEIPSQKINLRVKSLIADQEMIFGSINYWEGPLGVSGTVDGCRVTGQGFMELVGYPSDYNYLILLGKNSAEVLKKRLGRSWLAGRRKK